MSRATAISKIRVVIGIVVVVLMIVVFMHVMLTARPAPLDERLSVLYSVQSCSTSDPCGDFSAGVLPTGALPAPIVPATVELELSACFSPFG